MSSSYVEAHLSWGNKCLRVGQQCKVGNPEYRPYGFDCPASGRLTTYEQTTPSATTTSAATATSPGMITVKLFPVGKTVLLKRRTRASGCKLGPLPDRRCSPGAYYSGLTKAVVCSSSFHTSSVRNVPDSEKHQVEVAYGLAPKAYGRTLEIDHIVSLELGGSNDIANLYPEEATFSNGAPGYKRVFGTAPSG